MLTINKKSARYFSRKMGLFGNNKESQSETCNHGGSWARPLKQRRGKAFTNGKRKLGRAVPVSPALL